MCSRMSAMHGNDGDTYLKEHTTTTSAPPDGAAKARS